MALLSPSPRKGQIMNSPRQIVILCGVEPIPENRFSDTFLNNAKTFIKENPRDTVNVIDARDYVDEDKPMTKILQRIREHSRTAPIDLFIYSGHSTPKKLLVYYLTRTDLPAGERFMDGATNWKFINWAPIAEIWLWGCRTGGDYTKDPHSVAQLIANSSLVSVKGYICRTSQKKIGGKFYQLPEHSRYKFELFEPES